MQNQNNNRGFTLVEIIVSIAIFSIVIAVLGSVMITGFRFFYQTASTDLDKRSIDELASYVRHELMYATDVRITNTSPGDNWYSFSVIDEKLHHFDQNNHDLNIFNNDDFYNGHSLKMTVKAYENKNRLDLTLTMYDHEDLYTTKETLELLNVESITVAPFAEEKIIGDADLRIYYKKDKLSIQEEPEIKTTGTVADQISFLNIENNRGKMEIPDKYNEKLIYKYDMVYCEGNWWMFVGSDAENIKLQESPMTDKNKKWKCISSQWHSASAYEAGDIIIYNGKYYQCTNNIINYGGTIFYPDSNDDWVKQFWREITDQDLPPNGGNHVTDKIEEYYRDKKDNILASYRETVIKKLKDMDLKGVKELGHMTEDEISFIPVVKNPRHPKVDDIYKLTETDQTTGEQYVCYYMRIFDNEGLPGKIVNGQVGWQEIRIDYCDSSAYMKNDRVYYAINGQSRYLKCLEEVNRYQLNPNFPWDDSRWEIMS